MYEVRPTQEHQQGMEQKKKNKLSKFSCLLPVSKFDCTGRRAAPPSSRPELQLQKEKKRKETIFSHERERGRNASCFAEEHKKHRERERERAGNCPKLQQQPTLQKKNHPHNFSACEGKNYKSQLLRVFPTTESRYQAINIYSGKVSNCKFIITAKMAKKHQNYMFD